MRDLGIPFVVLPADIDETPREGEGAEPYLERIVVGKLTAVAKRAVAERGEELARWAGLMVADTTVVLDGRIVGKPSGVEDAERIVGELAGRRHVVLTRYAVSRPEDLAKPIIARTVRSGVTLRAADPDELRRYARSGEGLDKAGAYAIQGLGAFLVESIEGSYSNVVGLPACELVLDLRSAGVLGSFPYGAS